MQDDEGLAPCPVLRGIRRDGRRVEHERVDRHLLELVGRGIDEERLREERMPRARGDDPHADPVRRMRPGERVDDVDVAGGELRSYLLTEPLERLLRDLGVHVAPPDPLLGAGLADDELVLGRAAGVDAGVDHQRATFGKARVAAGERIACRAADVVGCQWIRPLTSMPCSASVPRPGTVAIIRSAFFIVRADLSYVGRSARWRPETGAEPRFGAREA